MKKLLLSLLAFLFIAMLGCYLYIKNNPLSTLSEATGMAPKEKRKIILYAEKDPSNKKALSQIKEKSLLSNIDLLVIETDAESILFRYLIKNKENELYLLGSSSWLYMLKKNPNMISVANEKIKVAFNKKMKVPQWGEMESPLSIISALTKFSLSIEMPTPLSSSLGLLSLYQVAKHQVPSAIDLSLATFASKEVNLFLTTIYLNQKDFLSSNQSDVIFTAGEDRLENYDYYPLSFSLDYPLFTSDETLSSPEVKKLFSLIKDKEKVISISEKNNEEIYATLIAYKKWFSAKEIAIFIDHSMKSNYEYNNQFKDFFKKIIFDTNDFNFIAPRNTQSYQFYPFNDLLTDPIIVEPLEEKIDRQIAQENFSLLYQIPQKGVSNISRALSSIEKGSNIDAMIISSGSLEDEIMSSDFRFKKLYYIYYNKNAREAQFLKDHADVYLPVAFSDLSKIEKLLFLLY